MENDAAPLDYIPFMSRDYFLLTGDDIQSTIIIRRSTTKIIIFIETKYFEYGHTVYIVITIVS